MTNKEAIESLIGFAPDGKKTEFHLLNVGLLTTDVYDVSNILLLKTAAIPLLETLISTADTGNSSTGWNAKYDRTSLLKMIAGFKDDVGITAGLPTIKAPIVW